MGTEAQHLLRGRFEVLEEIGEGGFAKVYRARETTTGQKVAIKVLKEGFRNDKEVIERFRREVFAVASINSPHVVGLKDFGISGDEFFIAMEFVEGPTLRDVIDQQEWSADGVHTIIGQVAAALEAAHAQNIVHRDLKPENVMLVSGPSDTMLVKVLDFGLAKLAELERNLGLAPLTRVGMCFGTPQYMSPELIYGKPVDRSVDIFALAVMAYEMIAGHRPWDGDKPQEVMVAVVKTPFAQIAQVHPSLQRRLDQLNRFFARALSKRKEERPSDAEVLFAELSEAMYGERRALRVPSIQDSAAELSAIHRRLPGRSGRSDETQIDMSPGLGAERTIAFPAVNTSIDGTTARDDTGSDLLNTSGAIRSVGRLSATWIPSMGSSPSLEEPLEMPAPEAPDVERTVQQSRVQPATLASMGNATREFTSMPAARPRWLIFVLLGGLGVLMVAAAAIGFFIGRGR